MKNNYALILVMLLSGFTLKAQVTLTKAANEPVSGNIASSQGYDSTTTIPKTTGSNQVWNFSSIVQNTVTEVDTYTTASSVPDYTAFPGATLADDGGIVSAFFKSSTSPSQFEYLGLSSSFVTLKFTNSQIVATWPFSYGSTFTDTYGGTESGFVSGTFSGTTTTTGSGSGTLILPGGMSFSNVLQMKISDKMVENITSPAMITQTTTTTTYNYFHSSQRFNLLTVNYSYTYDGTQTDTSFSISMNAAVITGINELNFNAGFAIYPNPARDYFTISLDNTSAESCHLDIYDATGKLAKQLDLGSSNRINERIPLQDLSRGIYLVKTSLGANTSVRRLIVE